LCPRDEINLISEFGSISPDVVFSQSPGALSRPLSERLLSLPCHCIRPAPLFLLLRFGRSCGTSSLVHEFDPFTSPSPGCSLKLLDNCTECVLHIQLANFCKVSDLSISDLQIRGAVLLHSRPIGWANRRKCSSV
jgi:hypothetical protein